MRLDILSENLKWARIDRKLKMETVEMETGISTSTLSRLERLEEEPFETSFQNIVTLADYYGVSIDYLLGRRQKEEIEKTELSELNLSDNAIEKLKSDNRHSQILSALITLDSFSKLLDRIEILTDRSMETTYTSLNQYYETLLLTARKSGGEDVKDEAISILENSKFDDSFDRYKIKEYIDVVLNELLKKYGNKVMQEKSVNSPMNKMLKSIVDGTGITPKSKKISIVQVMKAILNNMPQEQSELLQTVVSGVDKAVTEQNFKLKRNRKFE